jgi:hypothetical protein
LCGGHQGELAYSIQHPQLGSRKISGAVKRRDAADMIARELDG